jgi:hypothetical protein
VAPEYRNISARPRSRAKTGVQCLSNLRLGIIIVLAKPSYTLCAAIIKGPGGVLLQPFAATTNTEEALKRFYRPRKSKGEVPFVLSRGIEPSVNQPRPQAKGKQLLA